MIRLGLVIAALSALLLGASTAFAYPQWQLSTGAVRCNQCHFSPAGGGLINEYGRDFAGEELSTFGGNGSFLHGATDLPAWLRLGGDLRFAFIAQDNGGPDQPKAVAFPMQADLYLRAQVDSFAVQASVGGRGQVRDSDASLPPGSPEGEHASRFISREHWVIWQPAPRGLYARAGRFYAPFGLRLAEHVVYVRRDLGFNLQQETYNASAGYLENLWEAHLTIIGPDVLQGGNQEKGVAAYGELRFLDEIGAVALQTKYTSIEGADRLIAGGVGKFLVKPAGLLFLTEANYLRQMPEGTDGVGQFVGVLGASWLPPIKGILATLYYERLQSALGTRHAGLNAYTGLLSFFPYAHFEVQFMGRLQAAEGGTTFSTFLAQLHYYL